MSMRLLVFTPDGFEQLGILLAAQEAGLTGVLGLEYLSAERVKAAIDALTKANSSFWVSTAGLPETLRCALRPALHMGLTGIVLTGACSESLEESIRWCLESSVEAVVEVMTLSEAVRAAESGAAALVVKGNESGGRVGEETVSILLQRILPQVKLPVYARGGIGLHTAAACLAAGAAGVALDWQLALAEESSLPEEVKARIARMDGSETAILGQDAKIRFRAYSRIGETAFFDLKKLEEAQGVDREASPETMGRWREAVAERITRRELLAMGQDAAFAGYLAAQFHTVRGICRAIAREASRQVRVASRLNPLGENGPLAQSHGTRFPVLQGPMTRVSDNADFALAVAEGGALPFLALALMRGPEVAKLLEETKRKLGGQPWGVGILGFVPKELRDEQLAEVKKYKPPFTIIAGGRPEMAKQFEADGIHVYLHVPSPELTRNFLEAGARRLIFEGRECGGHVGPRTSFVLWDQMVRVIVQHLRGAGARVAGTTPRPEDYHIIFAGGIHDARSAAMVAAITAPLAERGVRIGVVIGTGYLFTREIVAARAITPTFQEEAVACRETVLVESGVGHATRCASSPFAQAFAEEKRRLLQEGKPKEEIRIALEGLNLGRLRIASKGIVRRNGAEGRGIYEQATPEAVRREGMFMIGQVAALRQTICSIEELHRDCCSGGELLADRVKALLAEYKGLAGESACSTWPNSDIAIVGLSCVLPQAGDVKEFWQNILNRRYAIEEIPKQRWDVDVYFDKDRRARDKVYSRWGGFIGDVWIDPVKFGMPPASVPSIEPMQLLALELVDRALADAGYTERKFDRERTCCIVGAGGGVGELGMGYGFRSLLPHYMDRAGGSLADSAGLIDQLGDGLPEWTEDSFAGLLLNVVAGRVANRFDFGGTNFTVDAACATGMAALRHAAIELETRSSDTAVVVAVDMMQTPFSYLCFSKTQALSPTGQPRVFDETADGIVISEGVAVAILKRLEDAILDGDRIYGVLKSVGASSDGKDKGLTAPRPIGQIRAFERAYRKADFDPQTVGLMEAHGTGTVVGDRTEAEALSSYFADAGAGPESIAVGSVKSMIGHTKCTAGMAGLIKAVMAIRQRVLPPTLGVTKPNLKGNAGNPLYINTETRPWMRRLDGAPRRAGVSAFGFGGTNFHTVLEEYRPGFARELAGGTACPTEAEESSYRDWPAELFLFRGETSQEITAAIEQIQSALKEGAEPLVGDLAAAVYWEKGRGQGGHCLALVATSLADLTARLDSLRPAVAAGKEHKDPRGAYYSANAALAGPVAFLFPGQGSQSVGMLADLAIAFPRVLDAFEEADSSLGLQLGKPLSSYIFPPPVFTDEARAANENALKQTNVAQPALGAADLAMFRLLSDMGIRPEFACGHSYGEFAALAAAGTFGLPELIRISEMRGRFIVEAAKEEPGAMAAVEGSESQVAPVIAGVEGVVIANLNAPLQTVISGTRKGIEQAMERLHAKGLKARAVPVACAFHSPLIAAAKEPLRAALHTCDLMPPRFVVFSNTTAQPHTGGPEKLGDLLAGHLAMPVRFAEEILAMYEAGARVFIECGPGKVLTGLTASILSGKPHVCIAMDQAGRNGLLQLTHALAQLAVAGVRFHAWRLFEGRVSRNLRLERLVADTGPRSVSPTACVVSNGKAVPAATYCKPERKTWPDPAIRAAGKPVLLNLNGEPQPASQTAMPKSNGEPSPAPVLAPASQAELMMQGHHRLMSKFLETHRNIMLAYLGQEAPAHIPLAGARGSEEVQSRDREGAVQVPLKAAAAVVGQAFQPAAGLRPGVPAAPTAPPETVAVPEAPPSLTRDDITKRLVDLVGQRTGYPAGMLGLDLDLEADLGVDSIKRVEIFGALQNESVLPAAAMEGQIEALSKLKTLRQIIDWLESKAGEAAVRVEKPLPDGRGSDALSEPRPSGSGFHEVSRAEGLHTKPVTRMLVQVVDAPAAQADSPPAGTVLVTSDGSGVAAELVARLDDLGIKHHLVEHVPGTALDLTNPAAVLALAEVVRTTHGPIGALVHLLPLAPIANHEEMEGRTLADLKSLFLLTKALEQDLRKSGMVLAATRMGGSFGVPSGPGAADFFAGNGAIGGFVKTLPREWPEIAARTVDFEAGAEPRFLAAALAAELLCRDGFTEIGYAGGSRKTLGSVVAPCGDAASPLRLDRDSVVLVTGGARGITADSALELAKAFQPRLVLVGRSPLPPGQEPADIRGITEMRQLKAALMDRMQTGGQRPTPALIEGAVKRIRNEREIRENLALLEAACSEVEYHQADVSDPAAMGALIDSLYTRYGRIDGVIHGAGIIEDKLIADKAPESFERVLRPKVAGALALARNLRPESLQFLVFFSSVSARYGNRGQCDYAAANEVLNKLARKLNAQWPGRVVSMNWGPWRTEGGMVAPELAARFQAAGVELIEVPAGCRAFLDELLHGGKEDAEVVFGGPLPDALPREPLAAAPNPQSPVAAQPMGATVTRFADGRIEAHIDTHPERHIFLQDHRIDGKPVLPMVMALEIFSEVAAAVKPDAPLSAIRNLRRLQGISYDEGSGRLLHVEGDFRNGAGQLASFDLAMKSAHSSQIHYRARIEVGGSRLPAPPRVHLVNPRPLPLSVPDAYDQWLFHGPMFAGIQEVIAMGDNGIIGRVAVSRPENMILPAPGPQGLGALGPWLIDPVAADSSLQLCLLWIRSIFDQTPLPSGIDAYYHVKPLTEAREIICEIQIAAKPGNPNVRCDLRYYDEADRLLGWMDGLEVTMSKALNRLKVKGAPAGAL